MFFSTGPLKPFKIGIGKSSLKYNGGRALGKGLDSTVLLGNLAGRDVAIKYTKTEDKKEAERVKDTIKNVVDRPNSNHLNFIQYYGCEVVPDGEGKKFSVIMAMELMDKSLCGLFFEDECFAEKVTYREFLNVFLEISKGLKTFITGELFIMT